MNALPQTHKFSDVVEGTFEEILFVDLDDKNSPYRNWVIDFVKIDSKSWKGDNLIAFKITMKNSKIIPKAWFYSDMLIGNPDFRRGVISPDTKTAFSKRIPIILNKLNQVTTWHLVTISKEKLARFKEKNWPFFNFQRNNQSVIHLAPEGRIFYKEE